MPKLSPVKVIAGLAAAVLSVLGLFYAAKLRQVAEDMLSHTRISFPSSRPAPARAAEPGAVASGVRVIPIGVAATPGPASAAPATSPAPR